MALSGLRVGIVDRTEFFEESCPIGGEGMDSRKWKILGVVACVAAAAAVAAVAIGRDDRAESARQAPTVVIGASCEIRRKDARDRPVPMFGDETDFDDFAESAAKSYDEGLRAAMARSGFMVAGGTRCRLL